jgi:hypothetical protein
MSAERIRAVFPDVEVVGIRLDEPISDEMTGEVLIAGPMAVPEPSSLTPRVDRFHVVGTALENLGRHLRGEEVLGVVDRAEGC